MSLGTLRFGPAERLRRVLSGTHIVDTLSDRRRLQSWVASASFDDFEGTLRGLNGILHKDSTRRGAFSEGETAIGNKGTVAYLAPRKDDRRALMRQTFAAFCALVGSQRFTDSGLLLHFAIQMIHPFEDANGRTGRTLFLLLREPYRSDMAENISAFADHKKAQEILADTTASESNRLARDAFANIVRASALVDPLVNELVAVDALGGGTEHLLKRVDITDMRYDRSSLSKKEHTDLRAITIERGGDCRLANVAFASFLASRGLLRRYADHPTTLPAFTESDVREIIGLYWKLKNAFVEKVIDIIVHPVRYRHPHDKNRSLLDYLYVHRFQKS